MCQGRLAACSAGCALARSGRCGTDVLAVRDCAGKRRRAGHASGVDGARAKAVCDAWFVGRCFDRAGANGNGDSNRRGVVARQRNDQPSLEPCGIVDWRSGDDGSGLRSNAPRPGKGRAHEALRQTANRVHRLANSIHRLASGIHRFALVLYSRLVEGNAARRHLL